MTLKTKSNEQEVQSFLEKEEDENKKADCQTLLTLMQTITGESPKIWSNSMIGFGSYHYVYESGREGDWFLTGFAPRKQNISIYIMAGFKRYEELMAELGKYKTGKSCLYIKRLSDIDQKVLKQLIQASVKHMRNNYS